MSTAKHNRPFKSVVVRVTDADKAAAARELRKIGVKPTMRNVAAVLREWASLGINHGVLEKP